MFAVDKKQGGKEGNVKQRSQSDEVPFDLDFVFSLTLNLFLCGLF